MAELTREEVIEMADNGYSLAEMDLSELDLSNLYLPFLDFNGADFSGADLSYSLLFNTNLSNTNLSRANLYFADLGNTDLRHSYLVGANLAKTKGIHHFQSNKIHCVIHQSDAYLIKSRICIIIGGECHFIEHWQEYYQDIASKCGYSSSEADDYKSVIEAILLTLHMPTH